MSALRWNGSSDCLGKCPIESYLVEHSVRFIPPLTVTELDCLWAALCPSHPESKRPSGFALQIVMRFLKHKPNDLYRDEFIGSVLSQTWIRFRLYYNSQFQPPLERFLALQAYWATRDFNRKWVPGIRTKEEYRPKGWVSWNEIADHIIADEGRSVEQE